MKRKVILLAFVSVLLLSAVPAGDSAQQVMSGLGVQSGVDWWPMFHHDPRHTGYCNSTAPNNNNTAWSYDLSGRFYSSAAVVNGKVFICGKSSYVALDAYKGTKIWNTTIGVIGAASPAVANGRVFVASGSSYATIWALNESTGAKIWNYTLPDELSSFPLDKTFTAANGKVFIGPIEHTSKVYALNETTGAIVWSYPTGDSHSSSSCPAVADGMVFVGAENSIYALNETTGARIWNYTTSNIFTWSSATVAYGMVFIGSADGKLYTLNETTGVHVWNFTASMSVSAPVVTDGVVFVESGYMHADEGNVYAVNATTGEMLWNHTVAPISAGTSNAWPSPAVADGKVFVGTMEGLYALNKTTGTEIWSYKIPHQKMFNSPAVAGGKVFIGLGFTLYAFGTPSVGGIYIPVNKLELLAPYIGLTILLAVAVTTVVFVKLKKKKQ